MKTTQKAKNMKKVGAAAGIGAALLAVVNAVGPSAISAVCKLIAHSSTYACIFAFVEETKMPKSLIK